MPNVRYATTDAVLLALDKNPDSVASHIKDRAKSRVESATQKWIKQTNRPFHAHRVGRESDPRTWEVYDVQDALSWHPATIILDNSPVPIDASEGDTIEVREDRDEWDDITSEEGDAWTLDYRRKRLRIFERRFAHTPWDDPNKRFVRLTYRHGPLDEQTTVDTDGLVDGVPPDVAEAVAAKAASMLAIDDDANISIPDNGQLTNRTSKRQALMETWESTTADYSGFSTL